jgi:dihydroorotate dehydrogenase electron transfer subunit
MDTPKICRIKKIVQETPSIKTFYLDFEIDAKPGQFAMAWLPGIDEKPFTLTAVGKEIAITVQEKGKFTKAFFAMKESDSIGIRGPYGNGFDYKGVKKACIVAGGCGAAPVLLLAQELARKKIKLKIILGARTGKECLFKKQLAKTGDLYITTDDGSEGEKGFTTTALENFLQKEKFDCVFACGPEQMLSKVFALCEKFKVECQLNLERFMKCSFGICGQCAINGFLVCKDGPVFSCEQLRKMPEFGNSARLKSTKKVSLQEYSNWRQT